MSFVLENVGFRHRTAGVGAAVGRLARRAWRCARTRRGPPVVDRAALAGVSAVLPTGAVSAVLGMSGSGKTTLLNLLGRLWDHPPTTGTIRYTGDGGGDYATLPARAAARLRRDRFGFVLQSAFLLGHLSGAENVAVPLALQGDARAARRAKVAELLDRAGMAHLADRPARRMSGGERQRIAVLRAVIHNPDVLFADEPFSSLDPDATDTVIALLEHWHAGHLGGAARSGVRAPDAVPSRTLILVTHDHPVAWRLVAPEVPRPVAGGFLLLRDGSAVGGELQPPSAFANGPADIRRRIAADPPAAAGDGTR